jgi:hypothetical protein
MTPSERYIAIGGESWTAALGQDQAKYLTPKVGIFLYGSDSRALRDQVQGMSFMSANAEMAMYPLVQIMEAMQERFSEWAMIHGDRKEIATQFQSAIDAVKSVDQLIKKQK